MLKYYNKVNKIGNHYYVKKVFRDSINQYRVDEVVKTGLYDLHGKLLVKPIYDDIGRFQEGLAEVVVGSECSSCWDAKACVTFWHKGDHGFINTKGKVVIPLQYSSVGEFHEGVAWTVSTRNDGSNYWYYIDKNNQKQFYYNFTEAERFQGGIAKVKYKVNGRTFINYINHKGDFLVKKLFDFVEEFSPRKLRTFRRKGHYGFLDTLGNELIKPTYDYVETNNKFYSDLYDARLVKNAGKYGFIDDKTSAIIVPMQYDSIWSASKNKFWAKKGRYIGCISPKGVVLIPFAYESASYFVKNIALIGKNNRYGYVDTLGREITPVIYEKAFDFSEGMALVGNDEKYGYINRTGEVVIPLSYDKALSFGGGKASAKKSFFYVEIDKKGEWVNWKFDFYMRTIIVLTTLTLLVIGLYFIMRKFDLV